MLDAANSLAPLYDTEKFNLFTNGFARKLSNVEFSALMVRVNFVLSRAFAFH
jgi:hypothetical protein